MMTALKTSVLLLWTVALLSACGGPAPKRDNSRPPVFETSQPGNGIKLFSYRARLDMPRVKPVTTIDRQNPRQPVRDLGDQRDKALDSFEQTMREDPRVQRYCPRGVFVIEKHLLGNELSIRGECK